LRCIFAPLPGTFCLTLFTISWSSSRGFAVFHSVSRSSVLIKSKHTEIHKPIHTIKKVFDSVGESSGSVESTKTIAIVAIRYPNKNLCRFQLQLISHHQSSSRRPPPLEAFRVRGGCSVGPLRTRTPSRYLARFRKGSFSRRHTTGRSNFISNGF